ncbi:MAG: efflux RND transporter permease subunit [Acidobacteria bacterium]|nr:efflux RND transporter permease subunit [Acidobacteriota bacterium]
MKRPVFATMLIVFLVVVGFFSFGGIGVDLFPSSESPTVSISASLPGASPAEVVDQVVKPLEGTLNTLRGLDEVSARVLEGRANITVRFVLERDLEEAASDVRQKVSAAMLSLPNGMDPPIVRKSDPDAGAVLTLNISSGSRSLREVTEIADKQIRPMLETVEGVGDVDVSGGQNREIHIVLDAEKLSAYRITVNQIRDAIQRENIEAPGGTVARGENQFSLRTMGRIGAPSQFSDIVVAAPGGTPIKISDIGRVEDAVEDQFGYTALDGEEAVSISISRQSGTNTVAVVDGIKEKLQAIQRTLPSDIKILIIRDSSRFIKASIDSLIEHLILGSILASLVVLLFLRDWRSVLIASLAIPSSIIATFTVIKFLGFTLNSMTLLALTLSVGIVIDDAVIVLENIFRYIEEKGYEAKEAAIVATKEIGLAVMATTLSLIVIFLPVAFISGVARRFVYQFGVTMAAAIMVSLLVAFTLTPMLSSRMLKRLRVEPGEGKQSTKETKLFAFLSRHYDQMLRWSLQHRLAIVSIAVIAVLTTIPLYSLVGQAFIPNDDQGEFEFIFDTPEGTSREGTIAMAKQIQEELRKIPEVEHIRPNMSGQANHCHILLKLVDRSQRKRSVFEIADEIRRTIAPKYANNQARISIANALGGGETTNYAIRMNLVGPDFNEVVGLGQKLVDELKRIPGLQDHYLTVSSGTPELQVKVDRVRAADLGIRIADVSNSLRLMVSGQDRISTYREGDNQYDVKMVLLEDQRTDPAVLSRLMIPSSTQGQVRLDSFATLERGKGPTVINRSNRQYTGEVFLNLEEGLTVDRALPLVRQAVQKVDLPPNYNVRYTGQVQNMEQTTRNMLWAMLLAALFMYMVLAAQFESFLDPLIIMLALPLSVPFAFLTLYLTGRTLNLWSLLGIFLLIGIVKKNGILQVDYTNKLRRDHGKELYPAIIEANHARLRPILMTTASIVAGLIPTAIGYGEGAEQRASIAITIIGGQTLCLLLTLLVTPVVYSYFAELQQTAIWEKFPPRFRFLLPPVLRKAD